MSSASSPHPSRVLLPHRRPTPRDARAHVEALPRARTQRLAALPLPHARRHRSTASPARRDRAEIGRRGRGADRVWAAAWRSHSAWPSGAARQRQPPRLTGAHAKLVLQPHALRRFELFAAAPSHPRRGWDHCHGAPVPPASLRLPTPETTCPSPSKIAAAPVPVPVPVRCGAGTYRRAPITPLVAPAASWRTVSRRTIGCTSSAGCASAVAYATPARDSASSCASAGTRVALA